MTEKKQSPASGELENLREILFGNQARATDDRLTILEEALQKQHRDLTDALNKQAAAQREATDAAERSLKNQLTNQANTTQANHQALEESLNQLRTDHKRLMDEMQASFTQELEILRSSLSDQIRRMQNESRQRDDDLRQELLTVSNWLDNKLTPRLNLGQMLIEIGQQLQSDNGDASSPEEE
ncbi:MAG: hypothetical protein H6657_25760 [Ardenticatenaceae bacterium]|nr:hypothetical protein [Anaerolineales bacterium]MCB8980832.1 hypothetical protein [Ardenticatenaceae bacterium]